MGAEELMARDRFERLKEEAARRPRFRVVIDGAQYKEGSSHPWRSGRDEYIVEAPSYLDALLEVLEGLRERGTSEEVAPDPELEWMEWTMFEADAPNGVTFTITEIADD